MSNRIILTIVGLVLIITSGTLVYVLKNPSTPQDDVSQTTQLGETPIQMTNYSEESGEDDESEDEVSGSNTAPVVPPTSTTVVSGITLAQVAQHNSRSSCWSAINGNVYDLTSWIPNHPGGEHNILILCGKDGSSNFNGAHGGKPKQATILAGFKLGVLTQ